MMMMSATRAHREIEMGSRATALMLGGSERRWKSLCLARRSMAAVPRSSLGANKGTCVVVEEGFRERIDGR